MRRASAERLFSLLTVGVSSPCKGAPETGERIDAALAAGLTAGMPRTEYLAGRLALCRDWSVAVELERALLVEASKTAGREKWRIDRPTRIRNLCALAIFEELDPTMRALDWRGIRTDEGRSLARQEWTGISPSAWCRTWRPRYAVIAGTLTAWRGAAEAWVVRAQGRLA